MFCLKCIFSCATAKDTFYTKRLKVKLIYAMSLCDSQIPRYILTLHELLAHTPHEHVERNSLDYAKSKLEELSRYLYISAFM